MATVVLETSCYPSSSRNRDLSSLEFFLKPLAFFFLLLMTLHYTQAFVKMMTKCIEGVFGVSIYQVLQKGRMGG